jgi:hypothetical protein
MLKILSKGRNLQVMTSLIWVKSYRQDVKQTGFLTGWIFNCLFDCCSRPSNFSAACIITGFRPIPSNYNFQQWGFVYMPRHRTSVFKVIFKRPVILSFKCRDLAKEQSLQILTSSGDTAGSNPRRPDHELYHWSPRPVRKNMFCCSFFNIQTLHWISIAMDDYMNA